MFVHLSIGASIIKMDRLFYHDTLINILIELSQGEFSQKKGPKFLKKLHFAFVCLLYAEF